MKSAIAATLLVSAWASCNAQESGITRLQCEGTYDDYKSSSTRDVPVKGMYVEISGNQIKVLGAIGFDATYSVITRREDGLGFQLESDRSYGGFLNRFSGQLSLLEKGAVAKDGSFKLRQGMSAVCSKAKSLF